jgi:ribosomal protein S26
MYPKGERPPPGTTAGVDTTTVKVYDGNVEKPILHCPHCGEAIATTKAVRRFCARLSVSQRQHDRGPEKVMRPCDYCGQEFGAREMRLHVPRCPVALGKVSAPKKRRRRKKK